MPLTWWGALVWGALVAVGAWIGLSADGVLQAVRQAAFHYFGGVAIRVVYFGTTPSPARRQDPP